MGRVCLNNVSIWRYGFKDPMWIMTIMDPKAGLALYDQRMKFDIPSVSALLSVDFWL
jgi:hypothetical protein